MRDLPPYSATPAHVTPLDDMARRLDGMAFNSVTSVAFWRYIEARLGPVRAWRWMEATAKQGGDK